MSHDPNRKGNIAELAIATEAAKLGFSVLKPLTEHERYLRTNYSATEVDAIGIYCADLDECFLVPIDVVAGQWAMQLRLAPARNGQRAALHFAEQYRLGAVAQLAERRRGTAEARGSNPLSSISSSVRDTGPPLEEVGAHEFRNHFGYYMERAAGGAEISISRRGRPYARLCPPNLKPAAPLADA